VTAAQPAGSAEAPMPSYIFEITEDGQIEPGEEFELADDTAAREEAMRAIGEMMSGEMPNGDEKSLAVYVRRAEGPGILTVRLRLETEWHLTPGGRELH
jgi:hypothetical protein